MNSSMRRASFDEMYSFTSKPRTAPPKRVAKADASKRVMGDIPLSDRSTAAQADSTVLPSGETIPRPVMTTRRLLTQTSRDESQNETGRTAAAKRTVAAGGSA